MTTSIPSDALQFCEASSADIPGILALYDEAGICGPSAFSVEQAQRQLEHFKKYPYYKLWTATLAQKLVGTYELLVMDNMAKAGAKGAVVEDVAVAVAYQGRGVGRAMMHHALQQARAQGCYKLMLSSNLKRTLAHRFYTSLGFTQHGLSFLVEL